MTQSLWLPARAKLNLVLRVVGRRPDGYHLLETLFHSLALHDDVAVERTAAELAVTVRGERPERVVAADHKNLAVRALGALQQEVGDGGGFHVRLFKRIPHGGGLGGGSSDAAAALRLGNALLGEPLDERALARLAVALGADVPFFLRGGTQWGRGVGDQLTESAAVARHFVLLLPPFGCDTAAVYNFHARRWQPPSAAATVAPITVPENWDAAVGNGNGNDLEAAAEQLRPALARLRREVVAAGYAHVRMTGSGSTLFVAVRDRAAADRCRGDLERALAAAGEEQVELVVTESGPAIDQDQPSAAVPDTVVG